MNVKEVLSSGDFNKCIEFHGHICPGLAIGFQAAKILMERLGVRKAPDEELLAIVETDACGADAIQDDDGVHFWQGKLYFQRATGKMLFPFWTERREKVYVYAFALVLSRLTLNIFSLSEKVRNDKALPKELERFTQLQRERTKKILDADSESLFKIEEISPDIPS